MEVGRQPKSLQDSSQMSRSPLSGWYAHDAVNASHLPSCIPIRALVLSIRVTMASGMSSAIDIHATSAIDAGPPGEVATSSEWPSSPTIRTTSQELAALWIAVVSGAESEPSVPSTTPTPLMTASPKAIRTAVGALWLANQLDRLGDVAGY